VTKSFNTYSFTKNPDNGGNPAKFKKFKEQANFILIFNGIRAVSLLILKTIKIFKAINKNHP